MKNAPLPEKAKRKIAWFWVRLSLLMVVVILVVGVALGPLTCGIARSQQSGYVQTAHVLDLALYSYASDHKGKYPDGKSSTEVFQQLLDQGYISDPSIFYAGSLHTPGKVAADGKILKPENVSWDVTGGVDASSPDELPIVFLTGYLVTYQPGSAAKRALGPPHRTWSEWWDDVPAWEPFMAYTYKNNSSRSVLADENGIIPHFIPADFDAQGRTYRQLTP